MRKLLTALLLFFTIHHTCAQDYDDYLKAEIQQLQAANADTILKLTKYVRDPFYFRFSTTTWLFWKKSGRFFSRKYVNRKTPDSNHVARSTMIHCEQQDALNWIIQNDSVIMSDYIYPYIIQFTENGITKYDLIHFPDTVSWVIATRIKDEDRAAQIKPGYLLQKRDAQTLENINYAYNIHSPIYQAWTLLSNYATVYDKQYIFKPKETRRLKR